VEGGAAPQRARRARGRRPRLRTRGGRADDPPLEEPTAKGPARPSPSRLEEKKRRVRSGALRRWLAAGAIGAGRAFRRIDRHGHLGPTLSDRALAEIVAAHAAAGLEGDFAGHSLRAGFATAAARAGRSEDAIMRHGRWKSVQIARCYIRQGARWDDNPAADLGL
jgi:Phage integrase family